MSGDGRYLAAATDDQLGPTDPDTSPDVYLVSIRNPTVTSVSPNTTAGGTSTTLILQGTNFLTGAFVSMGAGITVNSVTVVDDTHLQVAIAVAAAAATGPRTPWVHNAGTGSGALAGGFNVLSNGFTVT